MRWNFCYCLVLFSDVFLLIFNICTLYYSTAYYAIPFVAVFGALTVPFECLSLIGVVNVFMKGPFFMGQVEEKSDVFTGKASVRKSVSVDGGYTK